MGAAALAEVIVLNFPVDTSRVAALSADLRTAIDGDEDDFRINDFAVIEATYPLLDAIDALLSDLGR
jgi:hypothetical protein